ncbi:MAG TPA: DUF2935 domain-containing protein [Planctomycetota bacterium]|nr:DUF2935 domain-containing protein [Planctomycetota bacterium]
MNTEERFPSGLSRRHLLAAGGLGVAGAWGCAPPSDAPVLMQGQEGAVKDPEQEDTWRLPKGDDPAALAAAEKVFWSQVLMEHATMFALLMPGDDLSKPRGEAERFKRTFADLFASARQARPERPGMQASVRDYLDPARAFAEWKLRMRDAQASGRMHSFVWPSFFDAAAHEAQASIRRMESLAEGRVPYSVKEVAELWVADASAHASLIAHLADPGEQRLTMMGAHAQKRFAETLAAIETAAAPEARSRTAQAAKERADMESAILDGVVHGRINSIITPLMAAHMRREGLRFLEEVARMA